MGEGCCGAEGMCLLNVVDATVKGMGRGLAGQSLPEALPRPPRCAPMHDRPCHTGSSELLPYPLPRAERLLSPALAQGDGGNGPPAPEAGGVAAGGGGGRSPGDGKSLPGGLGPLPAVVAARLRSASAVWRLS